LGIPPIVAAFFGFLILANTGFVARFLSVVHLVHDPSDFPVLINDTLGLGVWLTHVFLAFPFFFLLFLASAQSQKMKVLQEASTTLGATSNYFMKRVIRPLVVRQNAPLIVIWFVFVLGTYEVPLLLGGQKIRPVALVIIDKIRGYSLSSIPVGYAMSAFYALFILLIAYLLVRLINKRYAA
jgi:putative spermidine/putrescine transport system permease protein